MRRVIDQLRRLYRLTQIRWTYDPRLGVWRSSEGWYVYAGAIMGGWEMDEVVGTRFYRSDTGEVVSVTTPLTELRLGEHSKGE